MPPRQQFKWPYRIDELLVAKIFALLHDPPSKPLIITGRVRLGRRKQMIKSALEVLAQRYWPPLRLGDADSSAHELLAAYNIVTLLDAACTSLHLGPVQQKKILRFEREAGGKSKLRGLTALADGLASSFDRLIVGLADVMYPGYLRTAVVADVFNPFNPRLVASTPLGTARKTRCIVEYTQRYLEELFQSLARTPRTTEDLLTLYHCLYVTLEPVVKRAAYHAAGKPVLLPADTRVPTHDILDHLYATATAANISSLTTSVCGEEKDSLGQPRPRGIILYVGFGDVWGWLSGARKLSDLWVASWLATSIIWYAVKELVWCLGPDVLLLPDTRWNHYYAALLEAKLHEMCGERCIRRTRRVLRDFYMYRGVPLYAWHPASVVLVLPVLGRLPGGRNGGDGDCEDCECKSVWSKLSGQEGDSEKEVARKLVEYVEERLRDAWRRVVETILDSLQEASFNPLVFREHLEAVIDEPPFDPVVVAVAFGGATSHPVRFWVVERGGQAEGPWSIDRMLDAFGLHGIPKCRECVGRSSSVTGGAKVQCYHMPKLVYALALHLLAQRVQRAKLRARHRPWTRVPSRGETPWRHCTVCRLGVATLHVPGREVERGRVDDEYRAWAARVWRPASREGGEQGAEAVDPEVAWRVVYPVFRPGEKLCPYCLVKRLAGLPKVFKQVAKELHSVELEREVRFPSTSDVAWLAGKLALIYAAEYALSKGGVVAEALNKLAESIARAGVRHRSGKLNDVLKGLASSREEGASDLKELARKLVDEFYWTPWLLYQAARRISAMVEGNGGVRVNALRGVVAALALAWMETRDVIDLYEEVAQVVTRELPEALRAEARRLREEAAGDMSEARRLYEEARRLEEAAAALASPRNYYVLLAFDATGIARLLEGLLDAGACNRFRGYLEAILDSHRYLAEVRLPRDCGDNRDREIWRSLVYLERYLECLGLPTPLKGDDILAAGASLDTILVSPSYHRALSNSLTYTLLRLAVVAERLGGIPVYMAGDSGLVLLPGWLPPSLSPYHERYAREALRSLRAKNVEVERVAGIAPERLAAWSPFLLYLALINRILWGSSSRHPGFHPVKEGGAGPTTWYIPALVATGLRAGVAIIHHRDHLHAAIEEALLLLEEARSEKPVAAVYHGRIDPTTPSKPLTEIRLADAMPRLGMSREGLREVIRSAGWLPALTALLNGAIEEGILSRNTPYDAEQLLPGGLGAVKKLGENPVAAKALLQHLIRRNTASQEVAENLSSLIEPLPLDASVLEELVTLLRAARTAAR